MTDPIKAAIAASREREKKAELTKPPIITMGEARFREALAVAVESLAEIAEYRGFNSGADAAEAEQALTRITEILEGK